MPTKEFYELCDKIATRAIDMGLYSQDQKITAVMDIDNAAKHFNMKLEEWLGAEDVDFAHDILGIANAINRAAHPADFSNDKLFLPRFAGQKTK